MSDRKGSHLSSLPNLITHADWSTSPGKRWLARARLAADGHYQAFAPEPVDEPGSLLRRLRIQAGEGCAILAGFDFPIGFPLTFARQAGIEDFLTILPLLGSNLWSQFYEPAASPSEIGIYRPFYPSRPGNARQQHLIEALGGTSIDDLRRKCERAHTHRRAACPLFWTLGAQQVGKAAITGWKEVIVGHNGLPGSVSIWPFSGTLEALLGAGSMVVAECYPAEFYDHLGVRFSTRRGGEKSGKRAQRDRRANAETLLNWADEANVALKTDLAAEIRDGFGTLPDGEDRFDAVVGLFGIINVVLGRRSPGEPEDEAIRKIEGWILGQNAIS